MEFSQVINERLSDKVVHIIMDMIKDGRLVGGEKLPNENELAEQLGVSRGILREALTILQARNYINRKPKEGTFINPDILSILNNNNSISLKEATFIDMIEMRECIEQKVVEKVIDIASDDEVNSLFDLLNKQSKEGVSIDYYFHFRLAELSKNAMFVNFINTYYDVIDAMMKKTIKSEKRIEEINLEHIEIFNSIVHRDKNRAKKAVLSHLGRLKELSLNN